MEKIYEINYQEEPSLFLSKIGDSLKKGNLIEMETQEKDDHFIDLVLKEDLIKRIFYIYEQVSKNSGMYSIDAEIYMAELSLLEFKRSNNSKSMT